MLYSLLILNLILVFVEAEPKKDDSDVDDNPADLGGKLVSELQNDKNLDLPEDEEYEDLRAELLAYHTALASLTSDMDGRRSLISTPCWRLGGICVHHNLCPGFKSLSEVPGCKDKLKVCCFVWNQFNVRDFRHEGIYPIAMPWSHSQDFGGKGIRKVDSETEELESKPAKTQDLDEKENVDIETDEMDTKLAMKMQKSKKKQKPLLRTGNNKQKKVVYILKVNK